MNITLTPPPELTGNNDKDLEALRKWCTDFYQQLRRVLYNLDTSNITELSGDTLYGTVSLDAITLLSDRVKITGDEVLITSSDGSQYLRLSGDTLSFCGEVTTV